MPRIDYLSLVKVWLLTKNEVKRKLREYREAKESIDKAIAIAQIKRNLELLSTLTKAKKADEEANKC